MTRFLLCAGWLLLLLPMASADSDPSRILPPNEKPKDSRFAPPRTLNSYFPMRVPKSKEEWEARKTALREQVLVSQGLWPMPEKSPLKPVIHGKIDRDDYTIEKVFFASMPGHYVCGNLYRPKKANGKLAGILCPHGHWSNGRFYDAGPAEAEKQIWQGAENTTNSARYPLQARCVQLARMGCAVFHYDMVGIADSKVIGHASGFADAEGELRLQSAMGLQTWNSIRALDFILSVPDVDEKRIGVTGASGGGTQTFMLCGIDDRPAVAFPAVMVSTAMQGGCVCENANYLRQDAGNIDLAGLFAPKPLAMTGAADWTVDIERKGLPELQALYKLYGVEDNVVAVCYPQFGHNYNQVSRQQMYAWMNKHLQLGFKEPIIERPFEPVPPAELSVFDTNNPRPQDALPIQRLRQTMAEASSAQLGALSPKELRKVAGTALRVMIGGGLPASSEVEEMRVGDREVRDKVTTRKFFLGRKGRGEAMPAIGILPEDFDGTVIVWVHPKGKSSLYQDGKLTAEAKAVLDGKAAILAVDVFGTGELALDKPLAIDKRFAGYTYGYNRPLLAQRVHDILTAVAHAKAHEKTKKVHLAGFESAGPWVLLARGLCGDAVARTAADVNGFRFDSVTKTDDEMMLPGALKYGGLPVFAGLAAPSEVLAHRIRQTGMGRPTKAAYSAAGATDRLTLSDKEYSMEEAVKWLLR